MDRLTAFYDLKQLVLLRYQETYPYVALDWSVFSSKDILQLIDDIEETTKQRISEKWIYTHLKPDLNEKLPRKDMLDILAMYCRYDSWDAFAHANTEPIVLEKEQTNSKRFKWWVIPFLILVVVGIYFSWRFMQTQVPQEIEKETVLEPLDSKKSSTLKPETELVIESPFYAEAKVEKVKEITSIVLKSDDYAMMLKAFIQSDIKDWETRKVQLNNILSDELEVLIHLQNNLGIEYMNKEEFAKKLIIPTKTIKNWQILSLEQDTSQKITKIRIKQN